MTTQRKLHNPSRIHAAALEKMNGQFVETIDEIATAIKDNVVVVVGMAQNPHVKNVKKALSDAGVEYKYLEYGSYLSEWKRRLAIKMWSGWATFPQIYVRGVLIGGEDLTKAAIADGTLRTQIDSKDGTATVTSEPATA